MTKADVKKVIGRLVYDDTFRQDFFTNPEQACTTYGYTISKKEMKALKKIRISDVAVGFTTHNAGDLSIDFG